MVDRHDNHLLGEIALLEENLEEARARFEEARRTFSEEEPPLEILLFRSALTEWRMGNQQAAAAWFEQCSRSDRLKMDDPVAFVRSLYFAGKYYADEGDRSQAREYFRRFLRYWGAGDMDRERVTEAQEALRS